MSVAATRPTVTTVASIIAQAANNNDESETVIQNDTGVTVFIGGPDVTTANGFPILNTASLGIIVRSGDTLYGIVASGSVTPAVIQTRRS
jgi:LysM repeat protein